MTRFSILTALHPVVRTFEDLRIPYAVSGSVASSFYGYARSTQDVDVLADIMAEHVGQLVQRLGGSFYIDADSVKDAITKRSSFNLIHLETMMKVDVFIPTRGSLDDAMLQRSRRDMLRDGEQSEEIVVSSAEDVVLNKLKWYRDGECVSERQWTDVLGILQIQRGLLDMTYMEQWAKKMNLLELLEKAMKQNAGR